MNVRVVVLPPVPALLPAYRGGEDPVAELRQACRKAIAWLTDKSYISDMGGGLADPVDEAAHGRGTGSVRRDAGEPADPPDEAARRGAASFREDVAVLADPPDEAARRRGVVVPLGVRVAHALLPPEARIRHVQAPTPADRRLLVMANGSACRGEKAPGHLDERSFAYDERIEKALAGGDSATLAEIEPDLLAAGIPQLRRLGAAALAVRAADVLYAGDPYGVRYWVVTWDCYQVTGSS